jgi:hypothetical protein
MLSWIREVALGYFEVLRLLVEGKRFTSGINTSSPDLNICCRFTSLTSVGYVIVGFRESGGSEWDERAPKRTPTISAGCSRALLQLRSFCFYGRAH